MLNKWIAESETQPIQLRSKKDEEEEQQQQQQQASIRKSEGITNQPIFRDSRFN